MKKAVLFDLDGTLVNSIYDIGDAMNHALTQLGQPVFTTQQYYHLVGNGMKKLCQRALAQNQQHLAEELLQRYQTRYYAHCCEKTIPYEGVSQLLEELHRQGYLLAVITNKPQDQAKKVMDTLLPHAPLDVVWGQQPPFAVKPDPAVYHHVCSLLGVRPEDTFYCGDSDVDMQFARNAGAKGIGCLWGFRDEAELKAAGAHCLANAPLDILSLVSEEGRISTEVL